MSIQITKMCMKQKHEDRASPAREKNVAPSDKRGWIDPIDTVKAGDSLEERVCVCACEFGRSPGRLWKACYIRVHECVSCPAVHLRCEACTSERSRELQ